MKRTSTDSRVTKLRTEQRCTKKARGVERLIMYLKSFVEGCDGDKLFPRYASPTICATGRDFINKLSVINYEKVLTCMEDFQPYQVWDKVSQCVTLRKNFLINRSNKIIDDEEDEQNESFFTCTKCESSNTSHEERQTRSADEACTVYVSCHDCGHRYVVE